jgi:hypothetical protein
MADKKNLDAAVRAVSDQRFIRAYTAALCIRAYTSALFRVSKTRVHGLIPTRTGSGDKKESLAVLAYTNISFKKRDNARTCFTCDSNL